MRLSHGDLVLLPEDEKRAPLRLAKILWISDGYARVEVPWVPITFILDVPVIHLRFVG